MLEEQVTEAMKQVFKDVPFGITHTLRVLKNPEEIMAGEALDDGQAEIARLAALLHDIGAVEAQRKRQSMDGAYQELEGPAVARQILENAGAGAQVTERVCFIVGSHHTPGKIDGADFQVLWDADQLDNLEFGKRPQDADELRDRIRKTFRTATGAALALRRCGLQGSHS